MRIITLRNYAKFNPVLEILGRDPVSGRHFVSTVLMNISHYDLVTVERTGGALPLAGGGALQDALKIEMSATSAGHLGRALSQKDEGAPAGDNAEGAQAGGDMSGDAECAKELVALQSAASVPVDMANLAAKAWERTCRHCGSVLPVKISVLKRIPFEAGLGGGSGNAAAVFIALARLFELDITPDEMGFLGAEVGADVPFFFSGGMMQGENFGELLTDLGEPPEMGALVLKPVCGSKTGEAYSTVAEMLGLSDGICRSARSTRRFADAVKSGEDCYPFIRNDFDALLMKSREIGETFGWIQKTMPERVVLAGSGSAVVGIYKSTPPAEYASRAMRELDGKLECAFVASAAPQGIEVVDWE